MREPKRTNERTVAMAAYLGLIELSKIVTAKPLSNSSNQFLTVTFVDDRNRKLSVGELLVGNCAVNISTARLLLFSKGRHFLTTFFLAIIENIVKKKI